MELNSKLAGAWALKSFTVTDKAGSKRDWQGGGALGLLIYTQDGHMSVSINSKPQTLINEADPKQILDRCLFYAGTYTSTEKEITHSVTLATSTSRIGERMIRSYELKDKLLKIFAQGDYGASELVWIKTNE